MQVASEFADCNSQREQNRYVWTYNKRARDKHFVVGEKCLILQKDDTSSSMFAKWRGPADIIAIKSPYSYIVSYVGRDYHLHANKLRKFLIRADAATCDSVMYVNPDYCNEVTGCNQCAIFYYADVDFGNIVVADPDSFRQPLTLPSQKIELDKISHLNKQQRIELLSLLDEFATVFADSPGLCTVTQHEVPLMDGFKPRVMRAYKVPENLKAEVDQQINELLRLGFIELSNSPQVSPLVAVLKPKDKDGRRAVRTCIDFRYVNRYTRPEATVLEDISEIIQQVGQCTFISKFDANSGYHQLLVKPEDRWLTAFVHGTSVYQWCRTPFGMKGSGDTFVRALRQILKPVGRFTKTYVDDSAVHSNSWNEHLDHLRLYLTVIRDSGFTLGLRKCEFAKSSIKFVGHIIGSGQRGIDPDKAYEAVANLKEPETKKQVRQILGFFSFWRDYIYGYSEIAKPLIDLTAKRIPDRIPFHQKERDAFNRLKQVLCEAVEQPLRIIDMTKPFSIFVDASNYSVGACLSQPYGKRERPVAFASSKLTSTQKIGLPSRRKRTQPSGLSINLDIGSLAGPLLYILTIIQ